MPYKLLHTISYFVFFFFVLINFRTMATVDRSEEKLNVAIFGPGPKFAVPFIESMIKSSTLTRHPMDYQRPQTEYTTSVAFSKYQSPPQRTLYSGDRKPYRFRLNFINAYLTDEAYNDSNIKYSHIQMDNDEMNQTKYDENDTLERKHILDADCFIIVYDIRFQQSLKKIEFYLQKIFEIKGYDKMMKKMRRDQMCNFPVSIMGINETLKSDLDLIEAENIELISERIVISIALEYHVDYCRAAIYETNGRFGDSTDGLHNEMRQFNNNVMDYKYYSSLTEKELDSLRSNISNDCCIL